MKMSEFFKIQDLLVITRRKFAYGSVNYIKCTEALVKLEDAMSMECSSNTLEVERSIEDLLHEIESGTYQLFGRDSSSSKK